MLVRILAVTSLVGGAAAIVLLVRHCCFDCVFFCYLDDEMCYATAYMFRDWEFPELIYGELEGLRKRAWNSCCG